jgi:hypothetical protein
MPSCNGKSLLSASIQEPRVGMWTAVIDVDSDVDLSGSVTIEIDGASWVGTITRGKQYAGRVHAQVVGGAGKLASVIDAKHYLGVPMLSVLNDLMNDTGEKLSPTTDSDVRNHAVSRWARTQDKAGKALRQVADETSSSWRVLRDGSIWLGAETWAEIKPTYDEIDQVPGRDSISIAPTSPIVTPGSTFVGRHVSRVTTRLDEGAGLRQEILFEVDGADGNRVMQDLQTVIGAQVDSRIDFTRHYPSKVVGQASDGTLDLLPDAAKMRGQGLKHVPIRHGIPGVTVKVPNGVKVMLFFEAGDQKLAAAALWPDGSSVSEIKITTPKLIVDGDIECTGEVTAKSQTTPVGLSTHQHPTAMGPSSSPTPGT